MTTATTYYEILSLPPFLQHDAVIPTQTLRNAYRRALLQNHPDKALTSAKAKYTIDQISTAFTFLSDPRARAKYDAELKLQSGVVNGNGVKSSGQQGFKTGVETVDLDDLEYDEAGEGGEGLWYRGCRCGQERGFEVRDGDLEDANRVGEAELVVGCKGCSLWLRVLFAVVEEDGNGKG